jgi:hypothetical protein
MTIRNQGAGQRARGDANASSLVRRDMAYEVTP